MIVAIVIGWALGVVGALQLQVAIIRDDPSAMPGGGTVAIVVRAMLWPLIFALAIFSLVLHGVSEL